MYKKPTIEEEVIAMKYAQILIDYDFGSWVDCIEYSNWLKAYRNVLNKKGIHIYDGCTKTVAVIDGFPWVLKADLPNYDFCKKEAENWQAAIEEGFTNFLAADYDLTVMGGVHFYIQEYAENDADYYDSKCYDYYHTDSDSEEENGWASWDLDDDERVEALIGGPQVGMFIRFCWDLGINDLHCGNFGQTLDGRTVIFDYSGY